jgi:hypothetical protein
VHYQQWFLLGIGFLMAISVLLMVIIFLTMLYVICVKPANESGAQPSLRSRERSYDDIPAVYGEGF